MKLCIQTFTTLLIIVVILLTGCNGDQQKPPEQVEPQADTQKDVTTFPEADADTTLPTTFYPPENPYEDLTETGTAPPDDYRGYSTFWIPEFKYQLEPGDMPVEYKESLPIAPNHAEKMARFEQHEKEFYETVEKKLQNVTSEKLMREIVKEDRVKLSGIKAEIMTEGMTPLNAAKYLIAHNIRTDHRVQYAQQAVDENPNDYHTLLVWTEAQYDLDIRKEGYRRLIKMRPNAAYPLYRLGRYTHSAEAIPLLKKAVQYAPETPLKSGFDIKGGALYHLAIKYYHWTREDAKALETLKYLSKFDPKLAQESITDMQQHNKLSRVRRPPKEKTNDTSN